MVCISDLSHVSISERVIYSYCSRDNIFVRLYECSDRDLNINKIWKQFQLKTNRIDKRVKVSSYEKNTNERLPHQSLLLFLYFLYSFTYLISFIINQHLESLIYQSIQQYSYILFLSINYNSNTSFFRNLLCKLCGRFSLFECIFALRNVPAVSCIWRLCRTRGTDAAIIG